MNKADGYTGSSYETLKCIWMASQVVEYKLCDKQFDCETCAFDKVIRNYSGGSHSDISKTTNVANVISYKLRSIKFDEKIIYLKNNLIAKEIFYNTYYLGINPILVTFLESVNSILEYERGKNILTGQQVLQLFGAWGMVTLSAPMNFTICDKVTEPIDGNLKSGWFAIIGAERQQITSGKIRQEEWTRMHEKATGIIEGIQSYYPKVGDTMHDGGSQIKFLYQLVGSARFTQILNSLNSQSV